MNEIFCFFNKLNIYKYILCIIYYINNERMEKLITYYGYNYEVAELSSFVKIINFCDENKVKNCIIYINMNNYLKKINKINEFLNIKIIKSNNIIFKNYSFREKYYRKLNMKIQRDILNMMN